MLKMSSIDFWGGPILILGSKNIMIMTFWPIYKKNIFLKCLSNSYDKKM